MFLKRNMKIGRGRLIFFFFFKFQYLHFESIGNQEEMCPVSLGNVARTQDRDGNY